MTNEKIDVNLATMRLMAEKIDLAFYTEPYNAKGIEAVIKKNSGDAANALLALNSTTARLMSVTEELAVNTSDFLRKAADEFESADSKSAREVSNG